WIFQGPNVGTTASTIYKIKLERGNQGTDWSPSPDDKVELAKLGTTIIQGGYIKTSLLNASEIRSQIVDANYIRTIELDAAKITTGTLSTSRLDLNSIILTGGLVTNDDLTDA